MRHLFSKKAVSCNEDAKGYFCVNCDIGCYDNCSYSCVNDCFGGCESQNNLVSPHI